MKRREIITSIGLFVAHVPFLKAARAGSPGQGTKPRVVPESEYEPFVKIAKAKGARIFVNKQAPVSAAQLDELHLDMNMVRASLENAIAGTQKKKQTEISEKLSRLLKNGTAVQQVEFVHGTGKYYFPEDVEAAIAQSENVAAASSTAQGRCYICDKVCMLVCRCLQNSDQYCEEKCRDVCRKYC